MIARTFCASVLLLGLAGNAANARGQAAPREDDTTTVTIALVDRFAAPGVSALLRHTPGEPTQVLRDGARFSQATDAAQPLVRSLLAQLDTAPIVNLAGIGSRRAVKVSLHAP